MTRFLQKYMYFFSKKAISVGLLKKKCTFAGILIKQVFGWLKTCSFAVLQFCVSATFD